MGSESWFGKLQALKGAHAERMQRAAGVSSVQLICHEDTWGAIDGFWLIELPLPDEHRAQVPKDRIKKCGNGVVEVTLSGASLVTPLKVTHRPRLGSYERAIARRTYQQLAKVIDAVDPDAKPGQPIPPIVLDDKFGDPAAT